MAWLSYASSIEKALALFQIDKHDEGASLLNTVLSKYLGPLKEVTLNIPSFDGVTMSDSINVSQEFWEKKLDGIYH